MRYKKLQVFLPPKHSEKGILVETPLCLGHVGFHDSQETQTETNEVDSSTGHITSLLLGGGKQLQSRLRL